MTRRTFLRATALIGAAWVSRGLYAQTPNEAPPAALSLASAINKAGRQRMLSQRCAKCWLMLAGGVLPDRARGWLDASIRLFEQQLRELATLQPSEEVRAALAQLEADWKPFLAALQQPPAAASAAGLWAGSDAVLASAHRSTKAYEALSGTAVGGLINIAGRQRMLSQRMAKLYFFERLGVEREAARRELQKSAVEFAEAMKVLGEARETTGHIASELSLAGQQWAFFEAAISEPAGERSARTIGTTSERILEQLDLVVAQYEALAS